MTRPEKSSDRKQLIPTLTLTGVVLLGSWMGSADGGYFVGEWAVVGLILSTVALVTSIAGVLRGTEHRWSAVALGLLAAYTAWEFASLAWSPNRGDAWIGAGQTLVYLVAFWLAVGLVWAGASRCWVLVASVLGPATIAALTSLGLVGDLATLDYGGRLLGTVGYFNGEAAFLLVPFWVALYLAGSRSVNPVLRGLILAGAALCAEVVVLTQSRGAMVAVAISLPVFFVVSGRRLRGLLALAPVSGALLANFSALNGVYLAFLNQESAPAAVEQALPAVWLGAAGAGLYGILWGLIDRRWRPSSNVTRAIGGVVLAGGIVVFVFGAAVVSERVGSPVAWGEGKWEAFKAVPVPGEEQNRYLSASGSGRYTLWRVAWEDFASHPLLGVGTRNYEATFYRLREGYGYLYTRQPHSLPLEVLAERGLIGGVLFFGFLVACLAAGLWRRFRDLGAEGKAQVGALTAALTYWFIHASSEWFWQLPAVTLPAVVYLAMLVGPWQRVEAAAPRWPLRAVGAVLAALAMVAVAPLYAADRYLARSHATADAGEALVAVERAQGFDPASPGLFEREGELATTAGDWARAQKAYEEAARSNPEHYFPYVLLARYYERAGKPEEALASYRKAAALNPLDEQLREEAAGQDGPDTDTGLQSLLDLCRSLRLPVVDQNCPPDARDSL